MRSTSDDKLMILKLKVRELVDKWTEKAQGPDLTEEERTAYYSCAEDLHNIKGV